MGHDARAAEPPAAPAATSSEPLGPRPPLPANESGLSRARRAVLDVLLDHTAPATVATLAAELGQHENTVREHLDVLATEGLATRSRAATARRGRPAWLYAATAATRQRDGIGHAELAAALAAHVRTTSPDPEAAALAAGRAWGERLALTCGVEPGSGEGAVDLLSRLHEELGFAPARREDGALRLRRCPLLGAAQHESLVVCAVHRGMVDGALHALGARGRADLAAFAEVGACALTVQEG